MAPRRKSTKRKSPTKTKSVKTKTAKPSSKRIPAVPKAPIKTATVRLHPAPPPGRPPTRRRNRARDIGFETTFISTSASPAPIVAPAPVAVTALTGGQMLVLFSGGVDRGFGTLGTVIERNGTKFIMTCAHVAIGIPPTIPISDQTVSRRRTGTGEPDLSVGKATVNGMNAALKTDAALVPIANDIPAIPLTIDGLGQIQLARAGDLAALVGGTTKLRKMGARTGPTMSILAVREDRTIVYEDAAGNVVGSYTHPLAFVVDNDTFGNQGDSGAAVVATIGNRLIAIGLLGAVDHDNQETIILPMTDVKKALGLPATF